MLKKSWAFSPLRATEELYSRPRVILLTRCNGIQILDGCFDVCDVFLPVRSVTKDLWSSLGKIKQNARLLWHQGISHHQNIFLSSFMFVHRSGKVTCNKNDCSYWGCVLDANVIGVLLTDENKYWLQKQRQLTGWMVQSGVLGDQSCFSPTNSSNFRGPLQSITLRCRAKNLQVT